MLDTFNLQCFLVVAEMGNFTRAAERLGRTQSAISQQINKLEQQVGYPLVTRGKNFALTPEGEVFLSYARQIFTLQCDALDRFKEPELAGEVRFGLPDDFASVFLADVLFDFARIHPRVHLTIECDLTLTLYERFKNQELDLVLVKMNCPSDFPSGTDVWSEPLVWVGNQALLEYGQTIPLVLSPQPCVYRARAISALEQAKCQWRTVLSSHSYAVKLAAVKAGLGVTVLPQHLVPEGIQPILNAVALPPLHDTQVSLLKIEDFNPIINSLEQFVLQKSTGLQRHSRKNSHF